MRSNHTIRQIAVASAFVLVLKTAKEVRATMPLLRRAPFCPPGTWRATMDTSGYPNGHSSHRFSRTCTTEEKPCAWKSFIRMSGPIPRGPDRRERKL